MNRPKVRRFHKHFIGFDGYGVKRVLPPSRRVQWLTHKGEWLFGRDLLEGDAFQRTCLFETEEEAVMALIDADEKAEDCRKALEEGVG